MKYIDAEKLKAVIKREIHTLTLSIQSQGDYGQSCRIVAYEDILSLIDSLQKEPPERICPRCRHFDKKEDCCNCPYGGMKYSINENGVYECNSFDEVEQQ